MKKIITIIIFLGISFYTYAQDEVIEDLKKHELKINAYYLVEAFPEMSYEYLFKENSAVGLSLALSIDNSNNNYNSLFKSYSNPPFLLVPYYRLYFGLSPFPALFFIEGNVGFFIDEYKVYQDNTNQFVDNNNFGGGVGTAIGAKFLTKKGWIGEVLLGIGRNYINRETIYSKEYPRIGVVVGKRF